VLLVDVEEVEGGAEAEVEEELSPRVVAHEASEERVDDERDGDVHDDDGGGAEGAHLKVRPDQASGENEVGWDPDDLGLDGLGAHQKKAKFPALPYCSSSPRYP
jgi:hypothetical protein